MNKELAKLLRSEAELLAKRFSDTEREGNTNGETFELISIMPKSDHVAIVTYQKNTGKLAVALALWINGFKSWFLFFPTDSHLLGLANINNLKLKAEEHNWSHNFKK